MTSLVTPATDQRGLALAVLNDVFYRPAQYAARRVDLLNRHNLGVYAGFGAGTGRRADIADHDRPCVGGLRVLPERIR